MHYVAAAIAATVTLATLGLSQTPASPTAIAQRDTAGAVAVFLDCQTHYCDFDFFRREIEVVNWVRDRRAADVHVIIVSERTGAGGDQLTAQFLGVGQFDGADDTLSFSTGVGAVEDEVRHDLARMLKVGLLPFIARSSGLDAIRVGFDGAGQSDEGAVPLEDPWNAWVFRASVRGRSDGDRNSRSIESNVGLSANRVTQDWKTNVDLHGSYDDNKVDLSDGTTFVNIQRNYSLQLVQVKSVSNHLSMGMKGGIGSSTYSNQRRVVRLAPAVEYDLFPYDQSARRRVMVQYAAGIARYRYVDTTIFLKTQETVPVHSLRALASARQPWGDLSLTALFRTQLNDASRRRASLSGGTSVRLLRGLSVDFSGHISSINDQIYLPKEEASDEEILVQQRERATSYDFAVSFGLSYTFGSIFNNVVNPRLASIDFF